MHARPTWLLAHEIARQFEYLPPAERAERVAGHVRLFWDPRMRSRLIDEVEAGEHSGDDVVAAVAAALRASA